MQKATRCAKACDPCRRRKERCTGGLPCSQCVRRKSADDCQFTREIDEHTSKRRKISEDVTPTGTTVHVPKIAEKIHVSHGKSPVVVGDSSTLGFLSFVRRLGASKINAVAGLEPVNHEDMLEIKVIGDRVDSNTLVCSMTRATIRSCTRAYCDYVYGIFDTYSEAELCRDLEEWSPGSPNLVEPKVASVSALYLVLSIGAEQAGLEGLSDALFQEGYRRLAVDLLEPATLGLVQALMVLVLYLLLKCRRNTAFVFLGSAVQAGHTIGLHDKQTGRFSEERQRAWRCLRILDISSCASLGRPVSTSDIRIEDSLKDTDDDIDSVGLELCSIAEKILRTVYIERKLSTHFALTVSEELKKWAHTIPVALVGASSREEAPDKPLRQQLCANHMTAAYYWAIILLTRPFLINDVLSKRMPQATEHGNNLNSTFVHACIDSAFRCLEATAVLLKYPDLPPKLCLVVNTTLVSALVLVLAYFGDYDKTLPLEQGLDHAENFLKHLSDHDQQAAQYLRFIRAQRLVASEYRDIRAKTEMERRGAQVCAIFGAIRPAGSATVSRGGQDRYNNSGEQEQIGIADSISSIGDFQADWSMDFVNFLELDEAGLTSFVESSLPL